MRAALKNFAVLALLFLALPSLAGPNGPTVGMVPENITNPMDVAGYLAWVQKYIPGLFYNNKDFPVNFWSVVQEQNNIHQLFSLYPEYQQYLKDKNGLLTFRINSRQEPNYNLRSFKADVSVIANRYATMDDLKKEVSNQMTRAGRGSSRGLLNDLIALSEKNDRDALRQNLNIDSLAAYYEKNGGVPAKFNAAACDLRQPVTIDQLKERFHFLSQMEAELDGLRRAKVYKENEAILTGPDEAKALKVLDDLPKGEFKNAISPYRIKTVADATQADAGKSINIELREQPISVAMFKNCVGVECTPARFASAPSERVFFIYDPSKPNEPKGYLTTALTTNESGKKVLYLKGFQGNELSPANAEAILMKAPELAAAMGADHVTIMWSSHTNYQVLRDVWNRFADWTKPDKITFPDAELRKFLDPEPNDKTTNGLHHSESMSTTSNSVTFKIPEPEKAEKLVINHETKPIEKSELPPVTVIERFEAGVAYGRFMNGRPQGEKANIFGQLGLNQSDIEAFVDVISNPTRYTAEEFRNKIIELARTKDGPIDPKLLSEKLSYIIDSNRMRVKDAFSPANESKNVAELVKKVRGLRNQLRWQFNNFIFVDKQPVPILKEKILSLLSTAKDADDLKVVSLLLSMLKPEHLDGEFTKKFVDEMGNKVAVLKGPTPDDPKSVQDSLTKCDFYEMIKLIYKYQKPSTLQLIKKCEFQWKLGYYVRFEPEVRVQFPEFVNSALWNLKTQGQNRWWMDKVDIKEINTYVLKDPALFAQFAPDAKKKLFEMLHSFCVANPGAECTEFREKYKDHVEVGFETIQEHFEQCFLKTIRAAIK